MASRERRRLPEPHQEPLFRAIRRDDPDLRAAYAAAADSIDVFRQHVVRPGDHLCSAKLRFRDPDLSEKLGEDQHLFLWLGDVRFHTRDGLFSGVFFEVPGELTRWHRVGDRLGFHPEDVVAGRVNDPGRLHGGFTLRVVRGNLSEAEGARYDEYIGVLSWQPVPGRRA